MSVPVIFICKEWSEYWRNLDTPIYVCLYGGHSEGSWRRLHHWNSVWGVQEILWKSTLQYNQVTVPNIKQQWTLSNHCLFHFILFYNKLCWYFVLLLLSYYIFSYVITRFFIYSFVYFKRRIILLYIFLLYVVYNKTRISTNSVILYWI